MLAIFYWLPLSLPHWQTPLLDASILTLTCLPFLWRFQLQPLRAALHQQRDRAQAVLETAADSILTMETAGRIESINPAAERLFGYKRDELGTVFEPATQLRG